MKPFTPRKISQNFACSTRIAVRHGFLAVAFALAATCAPAAKTDPADYVDPFIGTGGHGHTFPGATTPFGMVQASPDTRVRGWDSCAGYHYSDDFIRGFSQTHLSGVGIPDYCDVLLMPQTGDGTVRTPDPEQGVNGYGSHFSHADEEASPGYYAVKLTDSGIRVELTATTRVAMYRYTFPSGAKRSVVVDLGHRDKVLESELQIVRPTEIAGFRRSSSWAKDQVVCFDIRFETPVESVQLYSDDAPLKGGELRGKNVKALVTLATPDDEPVIVKVALSPVSIDGSRRNMAAELPGWDFAATRAGARKAWNKVLSRIAVTGSDAAQMRTFYTALYHAYICPNRFDDADGTYVGRDGQIHHSDHGYYTVFSLWDTYRAEHPLMTILEPDATRDFIRTFLLMYQQGGLLPVWDLAGNETFCMNANHSISVIADAYAKGIRGFDTGLALAAMEHSADQDHFGLKDYRENGFISRDEERESVARTLEYAYDDWCISQFAGETGQFWDRQKFLRRSWNWVHLFDPETKFFRARENGGWFTPFEPREINFNYTEGNAWHYRFAVQGNIPGLIERFGGDDAFVKALDDMFAATPKTEGRDQADVSGMIGQYAQGNEPCHHVAYLYDYAGRPDKTQSVVREIMATLYTDKPDGLCGNEDCGQMSAWYVFSALGFYPVTPGTPQYAIGSPLFDRATIDVGGGRDFTIVAHKQSPANIYVTNVRLNDHPLNRCYLTHAEIMQGGRLDLTMSDKPDLKWGTAKTDRPGVASPDVGVVPAPVVTMPASFRGKATVTITAGRPGDTIWYTTDGSPAVPNHRAIRYTGPFEIEGSTRVLAAAVHGSDISPEVEAEGKRMDTKLHVTVNNPISSQYLASGPSALVDGITGGTDFTTGRWQGYEDCNLDVVVDMAKSEHVKTLTIGFLQSPEPYILFPTEVTFEISNDGTSWKALGTVKVRSGSPKDNTPRVLRVACPAEGDGRYVRITAPSSGLVPSPDSGETIKSWLFCDEIEINQQ